MSSPFTQQEIDALYAPFPLNEHITREGNTVRDGAGIQWFTYIDRAAVQRRLEALFPGEWSVDIIDKHYGERFVTISLKMTIRGISRACNGGQSLSGSKDAMDEDKEKGAWTEAFRRVASVWGIGLYLYESDFKNYTDNYVDANGKKDWKARDQRQHEAEGKFAQWYSRQFPQQNGTQRPTPGSTPPPDSKPSTNGTSDSGHKVIEMPQKPAAPKGKTPKAPAATEPEDISKWEHWTPLMANDGLKRLYPDGAHRGNVIKLLKRSGAFKDGTTYSAALWRIQSYAKMRNDGMSEEDAVAATVSLPDALEGLEA